MTVELYGTARRDLRRIARAAPDDANAILNAIERFADDSAGDDAYR